MTKIKVSRGVADAIEFQLTRRSPEELLTAHADYKLGGGRFLNSSAVLHEVSTITLADALINGYEVEKTPEEKWSEVLADLRTHTFYSLSCIAQVEVIEEMAKDFGLKIEGVNA